MILDSGFQHCADEKKFCECDGYVGFGVAARGSGGPQSKFSYKVRHIKGGVGCDSEFFEPGSSAKKDDQGKKVANACFCKTDIDAVIIIFH